MSSHIKKILLLLVIFEAFTAPGLAFAQDPNKEIKEANKEYTLLEPLPCIEGEGESKITCEGGMVKTIKINQYIQYAFNLMIGLSALLAVVMIVYGGFLTMTKDSVSRSKQGKEMLTNAIWGLVLVLSTVLILKTVNPRLVNIPETLVTPLDPIQKKFSYTDIFTKLEQTGDQYWMMSEEYRQQREAAKREQATLQEKYNKAKTEYDAASGDPEAQARIETEMLGIQTELNKAKAKESLNRALSYFTGTTAAQSKSTDFYNNQSTLRETNFETIKKWEDGVTNTYEKTLLELKQYNATSEQDQLKNVYYSTLTNIIMLETQQKFIGYSTKLPMLPGQAIDKLKNLKGKISSEVTDESLKSNLISQIDAALSGISR